MPFSHIDLLTGICNFLLEEFPELIQVLSSFLGL